MVAWLKGGDGCNFNISRFFTCPPPPLHRKVGGPFEISVPFWFRHGPDWYTTHLSGADIYFDWRCHGKKELSICSLQSVVSEFSVLSVENVIMYDNVSYYVIMWYWNIYNLFQIILYKISRYILLYFVLFLYCIMCFFKCKIHDVLLT